MESGDDASYKTNSSYGGERRPAELRQPGLEHKSLPFPLLQNQWVVTYKRDLTNCFCELWAFCFFFKRKELTILL